MAKETNTPSVEQRQMFNEGTLIKMNPTRRKTPRGFEESSIAQIGIGTSRLGECITEVDDKGHTYEYFIENVVIRDKETGELVLAQKRTQVLPGFGRPTEVEEKVFNYLLTRTIETYGQMSEDDLENRDSFPISGVTLLDMAKDLNYTEVNGTIKQRLFQALLRMEVAHIQFKHFYNEKTGKYDTTNNAPILARFDRTAKPNKKSNFNKPIEEPHSNYEPEFTIALNSKYVKSAYRDAVEINIELLTTLSSLSSVRLYKWLNRDFRDASKTEINLEYLAQILCLNVVKTPKGKLSFKRTFKKFHQPAIAELVEAGVIEEFSLEQNVERGNYIPEGEDIARPTYWFTFSKCDMFYEDYQERVEGRHGFMAYFLALKKELGLSSSDANAVIRRCRKDHGTPREGELYRILDHCLLIQKWTPERVEKWRRYIEALFDAFEKDGFLNFDSDREVLEFYESEPFGEAQQQSMTLYQRSWNKDLMDNREAAAYKCLCEAGVNDKAVEMILRKGHRTDFIYDNIVRKFAAIPEEKRTPGLLIKAIEEKYDYFIKLPVPGSEHATMRDSGNEGKTRSRQTLEDVGERISQMAGNTEVLSDTDEIEDAVFDPESDEVALRALLKLNKIPESYIKVLIEQGMTFDWAVQNLNDIKASVQRRRRA